jgi:hypothetical protein
MKTAPFPVEVYVSRSICTADTVVASLSIFNAIQFQFWSINSQFQVHSFFTSILVQVELALVNENLCAELNQVQVNTPVQKHSVIVALVAVLSTLRASPAQLWSISREPPLPSFCIVATVQVAEALSLTILTIEFVVVQVCIALEYAESVGVVVAVSTISTLAVGVVHIHKFQSLSSVILTTFDTLKLKSLSNQVHLANEAIYQLLFQAQFINSNIHNKVQSACVCVQCTICTTQQSVNHLILKYFLFAFAQYQGVEVFIQILPAVLIISLGAVKAPSLIAKVLSAGLQTFHLLVQVLSNCNTASQIQSCSIVSQAQLQTSASFS